MNCEDCGTRMSDGMCPWCHEELFIVTTQSEAWEVPWSNEFRETVEAQTEIVKELKRQAKVRS